VSDLCLAEVYSSTYTRTAIEMYCFEVSEPANCLARRLIQSSRTTTSVLRMMFAVTKLCEMPSLCCGDT
jgi:hypothetical protein